MNNNILIRDICNLITGIRCDKSKCLRCPMYEADKTCGLMKIKERLMQLNSFLFSKSFNKHYGIIDKGGLLIGGDTTLKILEKARVLGGWQTSKCYYRYTDGFKTTVLGGALRFERLDKIELDNFEENVKCNMWETVYFSYI